MQNARATPLSVGDRVSAAGMLVDDGPAHRLVIRGEGIYAELLNTTEYATVAVSGLIDPQLQRMVTVVGTWTGEAIVHAIATEGGRGVEPFARLDKRRFADVAGADGRSDILRSEVLDACETIRGGALVAFLAVRGPDGWLGLASAVDVAAVHEVLDPLLGPHLHVVRSAWSLSQVTEAEQEALAVAEPYEFGVGWDADARFRAQMLVHHVSPELASVVNQLPADVLHLTAWLTRAE